MELHEKYLQKNGVVLAKIARELLTYRLGDRIPTIAEYVERYHVARGTVQSVISFLCQEAIQLSKHGQMGSYLEKVNYELLWKYSGITSLTGVMPLPLVDSLRGLATAVLSCMEREHVPCTLAFIQSANNRIQALDDGRFDFAVVSRLSADICLEENKKLEVALELEDGSYCKSNLFAFYNPEDREIKDGMRVAYDPQSPDQSFLTLRFCKDKNVKLFEMPYRATLRCLEHGDVDAIVYREESVLSSHYKLGYTPIPDGDLVRKGLRAVLVTNRDNYWIGPLLRYYLPPNYLATIQKQVESGRMVSYF
ncbi:GntR family transcriptional regulator YhfZ [Caproiciproducens sp.]